MIKHDSREAFISNYTNMGLLHGDLTSRGYAANGHKVTAGAH